MNHGPNNEGDQDMSSEYDFSDGVRAKYVDRFAEGCSVVVLDPDVARVFTNSESVNQALRDIIRQRTENAQP